MKINQIYINILLSFFLIYIVSCSIKSINSLSKDLEYENKNTNNNISKEGKKQNHNKHKGHKKNQRIKLKNELNIENDKKQNEQENIILTNDKINDLDSKMLLNKKSDSFLYVSWFIFVPLVLLIFIMTILSIAGFLILILNSTSSHSHNHNPILQTPVNRARNNLSNSEILEILKYKQQIKKKSKPSKQSNYKPEPESEGVVFKS
jgi:hypothetical protein